MDAQTTVTISVAPSTNSSEKPLPFVLKKIMSILPPNILDDGDDEIEKKKLISTGEGQSGDDGGGSGVSASLTPAIWEKTIPYDGENFHLEYMDLDEFLLENQIPAALEEELHKSLDQETRNCSTAPESSAAVSHSLQNTESANRSGDLKKDDGGCGSDCDKLQTIESAAEPKPHLARSTPSPISPEDVEVNVNFQPDPNDLVLSSIPGGDLFNPRKHRFSEEELKPQPIIKKAKKVFFSEDAKDDKYWSRRKKNNLAAKRSREARRLKENQIAVRANFLELENAALRQEVAELRKSCSRCKKIVALYEAKYGPL